MRKIVASFIIASASLLIFTGCSPDTDSSKSVSSNDANWIARNFGGTTTVYLAPGRKLEEITWKDEDDLWILSRPMREDEHAEEHTFEQHKTFGWDGTVVIKEQEEEKEE